MSSRILLRVLVLFTAARFSLDPAYCACIVERESSWDPQAVGSAGERGEEQYRRLLRVALALRGIEEQYDYAACIVERESDWQVDAVGRAGERGLGQLMPTTARWFAEMAGWETWNDDRLFDASTNLWLLAWGLEHGYDAHWSTAARCREVYP
jgi:soluble lytic murein transglycosylase-like protein